TRQVNTRQGQGRIDEAAGGEDHGVIAVGELAETDVGAVFDIGEQADVAAVEDLDQRIDDALDARMVGGDPVPDQPEGRGQALEQVDAQVEVVFGLGQQVGGVDAGGSGTDDGHSEGRCGHGSPRSVVGVLRGQARDEGVVLVDDSVGGRAA